MAAAVIVLAGCGTKTVTTTKTVTKTVVEQIAAPHGAVFFPGRHGELLYKPQVIELSATGAISNVHWSSYGNAIARGQGSYALNACEPTCALAKPDWVSASVELSRPKACRGFRAYTRIRLDGPGLKYDAYPFPIAQVTNAVRSAC